MIDCLYTGPPFGQFIFNILVHFQLHQVALVADIEKEFLVVSIAKKALSDNITQASGGRVIFRVASSPLLLNCSWKYHIPKLLIDFNGHSGVDSVTYGADSVEEAFLLYTISKHLLKVSISENLSLTHQY